MATPLSDVLLHRMDAYWRAANYLSIGQIYLYDNPLLRRPLTLAHVKPRLLGHWGTTPGQNFIYVHLNRIIKEHDLDMIYIAGPGHGGPALVANTYLEGTYSEIYPAVSQDEEGLKRLFRQFSFPGGIPSHVAPETPGSIHEGGELGYSLSHAFGAAFDNPGLVVACVIGDGEAETGPLATGWHGNKFLNPKHDGAVLPILHLNGYKIANPTVLARIGREELEALLRGNGYVPYFVEGDDPEPMHRLMAETLDRVVAEIGQIQRDARTKDVTRRPRWPMIVLRTPKGWTGPKVVDGQQVEGTYRAHQVPLSHPRTHPEHLAILERWMRSYRPEELFDEGGHLRAELGDLAPRGDRRMGANPHANGGLLLRDLRLPEFRRYAVAVPAPGAVDAEDTKVLGTFLRDVIRQNAEQRNFRIFGPDETASNHLTPVFEATDKQWLANILPGDDHLAPDGRVIEVLSEHQCEGWLEGYVLTGRHGLFNCYEAFVHIIDSMFNQHAKWLDVTRHIPWRKPVASLNILLASHVWRQDHNGFTHQDPGFIDLVMNKKADITRVYLPPDANCLLSVGDHCLRSRHYVNVVVAGKHPAPQWLTMEEAVGHCAAGIGRWAWASSDEGAAPDVVMACAGDVPTLETLAAVQLLREHLPALKVRVINVLDLMKLQPSSEHPHGLSDHDFDALFTRDRPVIFAYHGYPWLIHRLTYRRANHHNLHVRGYKEEGTITTPFDMAVLNDLDRFHLLADVIERVPGLASRAAHVQQWVRDKLIEHRRYITENGEDMPEIPELALALGRMSPAARILCLNSGSSSLKLALFEGETRRASVAVERIGLDGGRLVVRHGTGPVRTESPGPVADIRAALRIGFSALDAAGFLAPEAVGHRVVHGGPDHAAPERVTPRLIAALEVLVPFASLHLPAALAGIAAVTERLGAVPQVACFDTAFHRRMPEVSQRLPLPLALWSKGIRRYGFHGLSYEYVVATVGAATLGRAVIAHLGNGASMAAVRDGVSVDTTMGFTPTGGFMMGTRSGDLDPGVLVHLLAHEGYDVAALERLVDHEAGLLGVSGISADMKTLLDARADRPTAAAAVELFCHQLRKHVGALAAVLGGLDTLVFTGGIGEHAAPVRFEACRGLEHLGIHLDPERNARHEPVISADRSACTVRIVPTDEDLMIARHTRAVLGS